MEKVTYASLGTLGEEFHREFESAVERLRGQLGQTHPIYIGGKAHRGRKAFADVNPSDHRVELGRFTQATPLDVRRALLAAQAAFPLWRSLDWRQRIALLRKAADRIVQRQVDLAALLSMETGKNRVEAIAEVSETADLIYYYCRQMEEHDGYVLPMEGGAREQTRSILKPYGVWVVIAPFNFPMALGAGMAAGALIGGNTVLFKPASDTPFSGLAIYEAMRDAGLPEGVFNFITGSGPEIGKALTEDDLVSGLIFTGSRAVGMRLLESFSREYPKPCITEMGGKNPAIIMTSADLDAAAEGVYRSAFGMGGQKCSACSRLYLHREIAKPFMERLLERVKHCKIGDALARDTFLGPLINPKAVQTYARAVRLAQKEGRILHGGRVLQEGPYGHGYFVEPTVVHRLPKSSTMFQDEYFAPILAVAEVKSLEEAIMLSNHSGYGLTAGIFTQDEQERRVFFDTIEAGVTYCNRRGGATTGAWHGVQSFGGWKGSGSSGKSALGPYYVAQFMREQSQTLVQP